MKIAKRPPIIYFTGLDGSGKTTFANMLAEDLRRQGWPVKVVWLRMSHYLSKPLLLFCRIAALTEYEVIDGVRVGYHHFYRSKIISWLYILLRGIDTWFDALIRVYIPARLFGKTIICDRYIFDALIDLIVDTHRTDLWNGILIRSLIILLPKESRILLIERDQSEIIACRDELRLSKTFRYRSELYKKLSKHFLVTIIKNDDDVKKVYMRLFNTILMCD